MYTWSKIRVYLSGQKNIKIIYGNALKTDFWAYDVVYIFWMPDTLVKKLLPRLQETVKENFRLVSYCFQMKNGFFDEKVYKKEKKNNIYEYRVRKHHHI
jgi:predicted RNA methylase